MNADPVERVRSAFSKVLRRHRQERNLTIEMLAHTSGFFETQLQDWENTTCEPDLTDLFRLAWALGEEPVLLFIDLVAAWRADPSDLGLYKSRASDFAKLYRLGYAVDPGDFRELPRTYSLINEAVRSARMLNATRNSKRQPLLDTVLTYVRLGSVLLRADEERRA